MRVRVINTAEEEEDLLNKSTNYSAVCRTTLALRGLSKMVDHSQNSYVSEAQQFMASLLFYNSLFGSLVKTPMAKDCLFHSHIIPNWP